MRHTFMNASFTKFSLMALMFVAAVSCNAEGTSDKPSTDDCKYTRANMAVKVPAGNNIVNSYLQKSTELVGFVDRFHLVFADGSSAVVQHSYCLSYSFSVAYYAKNTDDINNEKKVAEVIERLFAYNAYDPKKISFKKPLRQIIEPALKEKGYDAKKRLIAELSTDDVVADESVYLAFAYYPLSETGASEAAIDFTYVVDAAVE